MTEPCPECDGAGEYLLQGQVFQCERCSGTGIVGETEEQIDARTQD